MISCPAAKQMRWVNPSIATVSPSRTRSATASRIVATLPPSGIAAFGCCVRPLLLIGWAEQDAELVPLGVLQYGPGRLGSSVAHDHGGTELDEPGHLRVAGSHRGQVQMETVLHGLGLGHLDEDQSPAGCAGDEGPGVVALVPRIDHLVAQHDRPEVREAQWVDGVERERVDR